MHDPAPTLGRAAPFLRLAAAGLLLSIVASLYRGVQWWRIQSANIPEEIDDLHTVLQIAAAGDGLAALLIATGILSAAFAMRGPMKVAAVGAIAYAAQVILWTLQPFLEASELAAVIGAIPWPVFVVAHITLDVGLVLTLIRRQGGRVSGTAGIAIGVVTLVWGWTIAGRLGLRFEALDGPAALLAHAVIGVVHSAAVIAVLLAIARSAVAEPRVPVSATAASSGLRLFGTGLKLRIVCLVGVVSLSILLTISRSPGGMKAVLYGGTLLSMGAGVIMIAGLARYAFAGSHDVGAVLATLLMTAGLLLDLWVVSLLGDLFGGRLGAAWGAQESLAWAQGAGQVMGLIAMLALLSSVRQVARLGDAPELARRAGGLMVLVMIVAGLATGVRILASMRRVPVALGLTLGVAALIAAIVMVVRLLGLIKDVARQLEADAA